MNQTATTRPPRRRRLRILWQARRWRTKIIFARRGPIGSMFGAGKEDSLQKVAKGAKNVCLTVALTTRAFGSLDD